MRFSELVRLLEREGFRLIKEKGSIRYYAKTGHPVEDSCEFVSIRGYRLRRVRIQGGQISGITSRLFRR